VQDFEEQQTTRKGTIEDRKDIEPIMSLFNQWGPLENIVAVAKCNVWSLADEMSSKARNEQIIL
jgi:hypothetical protein